MLTFMLLMFSIDVLDLWETCWLYCCLYLEAGAPPDSIPKLLFALQESYSLTFVLLPVWFCWYHTLVYGLCYLLW